MQFYSDEYKASKQWPYAVSSGCIVYRLISAGEPEVLVLYREFNPAHLRNPEASYNLPKGTLNLGESLEHCALRETREEAAVDCQITTYLGARTEQYQWGDMTVDKTIHYFAAQWLNDQGEMDHEHDSKHWVSLQKATELLGAPNPKREDQFIQRLKSFLELQT